MLDRGTGLMLVLVALCLVPVTVCGEETDAVEAAGEKFTQGGVVRQTATSTTFSPAVVEFLRRTGLETGGTYRSSLHTVLADDEWAVAIYRAQGRRNGIDLDVDQALVIRCEDGRWKEITAVPLDSTFDAFWA